MSLCCGIAVREITPPAGLPMGGYAARAGVAQATLDPLFCRAAVLADGQTSIALVALDLLYVTAKWTAPLRQGIAVQLGCSADNVLIAATHTHAGPAVFQSGLAGCDALQRYEGTLADAVRRTVDDARRGLKETELAVGSAATTGIAKSRRQADDAIDATVRVVVARSSGGQPAAVIAVFGCHPTVLPAANLRYSRDLFGAAVDAAEGHLGAPVMLFNGAAADVSTRFTRGAQDESEVERLGRRLGDSIAAAARSATATPGAPIGAWVEGVPMTPRALPSVEAAQRAVEEAAALVESAQQRPAEPGALRHAMAGLEGAFAQLFLATHGGTAAPLGRQTDRTLIQLLRTGGADILAVPGELFSSVGQQICAARARPALLIGYANDYLGYLVPPVAAAAGGYEALAAFIEPAAAQKLAEKLAALGMSSAPDA